MILENCWKSYLSHVKKYLLAPIALFGWLFLASCGDAGPEDVFNQAGPGGRLHYYLGYGYDVINSSYINRSDVKISHPVLDLRKMVGDGLVVSEEIAGQQDFQMSVGTSVARFYSERNAGLGISASAGGSNTGALFSGKFGAEFSVSISESRIDTNSYLRGRSYRYTQDDYIKGATTERLLGYLTGDFAADLQTKTAAQILDRYGTHVLVRYFKGGALEFNYAYSGKGLTATDQMKAALNASFGVISGGASGSADANRLELERNSTFHYYTYGGTPIDAFRLEELKNNYSGWLNSIESHADICGMGNFDQSLVSLWELAEANGDAAKAKDMEAEFNRRAVAAGKALLVKKIRTETKEFTNDFNLYGSNASYSYTFSNASKNSPAEIEVYALGAGGGGQGGHKKVYLIGSDDIGTGGAGGGGATAYMKLVVEGYTSFDISVGGGGVGGDYTHTGVGPDLQSGKPGKNGGNTTVLVSGIGTPLTARGGLGGGGVGTAITGGSGGTAEVPTSLLRKDGISVNGNSGSNGDLTRDKESKGGAAATVTNRGSLPSFGGGAGALRQVGGNTQSAGRGGGGCGGYSDRYPGGYGTDGGSGHVIIIVRYYADE